MSILPVAAVPLVVVECSVERSISPDHVLEKLQGVLPTVTCAPPRPSGGLRVSTLTDNDDRDRWSPSCEGEEGRTDTRLRAVEDENALLKKIIVVLKERLAAAERRGAPSNLTTIIHEESFQPLLTEEAECRDVIRRREDLTTFCEADTQREVSPPPTAFQNQVTDMKGELDQLRTALRSLSVRASQSRGASAIRTEEAVDTTAAVKHLQQVIHHQQLVIERLQTVLREADLPCDLPEDPVCRMASSGSSAPQDVEDSAVPNSLRVAWQAAEGEDDMDRMADLLASRYALVGDDWLGSGTLTPPPRQTVLLPT